MTPLMKQFWEIKNQHEDKILLFRMGDFYEMFYKDAEVAAPILNIALTSRNKKAKDDTPMCGVPHHSIAGPISKLLAAGHKVAICDQLEDPAEAKGIVKRGVTRILTPGMVYDPDTLEESDSNFIAAFDDDCVAVVDTSAGICRVCYPDHDQKTDDLLILLNPTELVLTSGQRSELGFKLPMNAHLSVSDALDEEWPEAFQKIPAVAQRLLTYIVNLQGPKILSSLRPFEVRRSGENMSLRAATIRHLEIFENYRGQKEGSLFHSIKRNKTSAGARLLKNWLQFPLLDVEKIEARQSQVRFWMEDMGRLKQARERLGQMGDIERRLAKISYSTCHPRDLLALSNSLKMGMAVSALEPQPKDLSLAQKVAETIDAAIAEDPPAQMKKGGFIRKGFRSKLDELVDVAENSTKLLLELEARERESTGIPSLKVRYNSVFGYYIEVTNVHKDKVPSHYARKQTLTNAERYITEELDALELKVLSARSKRLELEESIFEELKQGILRVSRELLGLATHWSELDIYSSMAWLAMEHNYSLPKVIEEGDLKLIESRHPVVQQELSGKFIPNDIYMPLGHCMLLTGPNMAGKSTLMRQVAICALMAQIGGVVPCREAQIPIFDQIFTRIGASDFLAEGLSTFMVEMTETAELVKKATAKSLVILDEIGRGTSTYDGMSLAQAILEELLTKAGLRSFFATHYHELTALEGKYQNLSNFHMAIEDKGKEISFSYELRKGPANKSYGIQVARLAGLSERIVLRASELLKVHESSDDKMERPTTTQLDLSPVLKESSAIENELESLDVNSLTPIEALNKLNQWRQSLS